MNQRVVYLCCACVVTSACTADTTTLAELAPRTSVSLGASEFSNGVVDVMFRVEGDDCPTLDAGASATFNGLSMMAGRGGMVHDPENGDYCNPITFELLTDPYDVSSATFGRGPTATLVISDASATWTIEVDKLLRSDIQLTNTPTTNGTIQLNWPDADTNRCGFNPCWTPSVVFFDATGKYVTHWAEDRFSTDPGPFTPMGGGWGLALKWASSASAANPSPGTTSGSLVIAGRADLGGPANVCDGPTQCYVPAHDNVAVHPATLF